MFKHCSPLEKMAEITEFLYLGGLAAARKEEVLMEKGITCVINGQLKIISNTNLFKLNTECVSCINKLF